MRRFLRLKKWQGTERIVIGGGLSASHIGELAMGRAAVLLAGENIAIELRTIANHPDKAGLIGAVQLAPSWVLAGHDAILAADIGGTNLRVGVVEAQRCRRRATSRRPRSGSICTGGIATTSRHASRRWSAWPRWPAS